MTVKVSKPAINVREELADLRKPTGVAGEAMLRAETPQEQFNLIGAGRRRLNINGGMSVWQRGTSATDITSGDYLADRWSVEKQSTYVNAMDVDRSTDAPSNFPYSLQVTIPTGNTLVSQSYAFYVYKFESQDLAHLGWGGSDPKPLTVSFWIKASAAGQYALNMYAADSGTARINTIPYTIDAAGVWEKKTITFSADDSGAFTVGSTGTGLWLQFWLMAGSNYTGGGYTNGWVNYSGNTTKYAGEMSADPLASSSGYVRITGVQVESGKVATPFEYRSYGEELALCQRYYQYGQTRGGIPMYDTYGFYPPTHFNTSMRSNPTVSVTATEFRPTGSGGQTPAYISSQNQLPDGFGVIVQASSSYQDQNGYGAYSWTADAEL